MKKSFWLLLGAAIALFIAIPLGMYFVKFNGPLSGDPSVWGSFGDYLNPFVALFNVAAFVYLTRVIHQQEERREHRRMHLPKAMEAEKAMHGIIVTISMMNYILDAQDTLHKMEEIKREKDSLSSKLTAVDPQSEEFKEIRSVIETLESKLMDVSNNIRNRPLIAGKYKELVTEVSKFLKEYRHTLKAVNVRVNRIVDASLGLELNVHVERLADTELEYIMNPESLVHFVKFESVMADEMKILKSYIWE